MLSGPYFRYVAKTQLTHCADTTGLIRGYTRAGLVVFLSVVVIIGLSAAAKAPDVCRGPYV